MGRLAEIEKVLLEAEERLQRIEVRKKNTRLEGIPKICERLFLVTKAFAYDKIHKILMEDE